MHYMRVWGVLVLAVLVGAVSVYADSRALVLTMVSAAIGAWLLFIGGTRALLALTLVLLAAATFLSRPFESEVFYGRYIAAAGLAVAVWCASRPQQGLPDSGAIRMFVGPLWVIAFLGLASTIWSFAPLETLQQAVAFLLVVAVVHGFASRRWTTKQVLVDDLCAISLVLNAILAASLLARFLGMQTVDPYSHRFHGLFANPNTLAAVSVLSAPLAYALWRHTRNSLFAIGSLISLACLVLSESRTALLALFGAVSILLMRKGVARFVSFGIALLMSGLTVGLLFPWLIGVGPVGALASRFTADEPSALLSNRGAGWQHAIDLWEQNPLGGVGFRVGELLFQEQQSLLFSHGMAHNSYLQILLELGLLVIPPLALLLYVLARVMVRLPSGNLSDGLAALIASGLLVGLTESALWGSGAVFSWVYWLLAGAATAWLRLSSRTDWDTNSEVSLLQASSDQS